MRVKIKLDTSISCKLWRNSDVMPTMHQFKVAAKKILPSFIKIPFTANGFVIDLVFSDSEGVMRYNGKFFNKNKTTNVLSFPQIDFNSPNINFNIHTTEGYIMLGSIIFDYYTICLESSEQNKLVCNHVMHLFIHSVLHLIGYDHQIQSEQEFMEKKEIELLHDLGIANPYEI